MKLKKLGIIISVLLIIMTAAYAEETPEKGRSIYPRLLEVEDYIGTRIKDYLATRFPQRPFSVLVQVTPSESLGKEPVLPGSESEETAEEKSDDERLALPHLDLDPAEEKAELWWSKDAPIEQLLSQVKKIDISLNVPSELSDSEAELLRSDLHAKLHLDDARDKLTITKRDWTPVAAAKDGDVARTPASDLDKKKADLNPKKIFGLDLVFVASLAAIILGLVALWFISNTSVNKIVGGLGAAFTDLWSKIEKAGGMGSGAGGQSSSMPSGMEAALAEVLKETRSAGSGSSSNPTESVDVRQALKDLLPSIKEIFSAPQVDLMEILEQEGTRHPGVVGSLFFEVEQSLVQNLFALGSGNWWFTALTSPEPLGGRALALAERIVALKTRRAFDSNTSAGPEMKKLILLLSRLSENELLEFFAPFPFSDAGAVLSSLSASQALTIAKTMYPENWAEVLNSGGKQVMPSEKGLKTMVDRASKMKLFRDSEQIRLFFKDLDLRRYLDDASPEDERAIYEVLAADSGIIQHRMPFFSVFGLTAREVTLFSGIISNKEWALALRGTNSEQLRLFLAVFPERQRYLLNEAFAQIDAQQPSLEQVRDARRKITSHFQSIKRSEQNTADNIEGSSAEPMVA